MSEVNTNRLDQAFARLQAYPLRDSTLDRRFQEWICSADDDSLNRINAYALATAWNVNVQSVLLWLIYASQVGLFDLHWVTHCIHCNGTSHVTGRMGTVEHKSYCKMCQLGYSVHSDENIEVAFTVNPSIRPTQLSLQASLPPGVIAIGQWDGNHHDNY